MDSDTFEKLAFASVGWLFGLLAPVIVDAIKRRRENALGQVAIYAELRDVGHKLALSSHLIHMHMGTVTRSHLEMMKIHFEGYVGYADTARISEAIRVQLAMTDEQLENNVKLNAAGSDRDLVLQKLPVPLLDSRVSALWSFETAIQRRLLEIRSRMGRLNDLVDRSQKFSDWTFGKLDEENYRRAIGNLEQCYSQYAASAEATVEHIRQLRYEL
jgi:hypothetical protein